MCECVCVCGGGGTCIHFDCAYNDFMRIVTTSSFSNTLRLLFDLFWGVMPESIACQI